MRIIAFSESGSSATALIDSLELLDFQVERKLLSDSLEKVCWNQADLVTVDACAQAVLAKNTAHFVKTAHPHLPLLLIIGESNLPALSPQWMIDDFLIDTASLAEISARLKLLYDGASQPSLTDSTITTGVVSINEASYTARLVGAPLNLTYKEFELLKFLVHHQGHVFTRAQLLTEVWGYDYYGGTRTVDVHIRRLRAKLGTEHEHLIQTVRNVGYSFNVTRTQESAQ